MSEIDIYDPLITGTKGLVFIGDKILVYQRDDKTDKFPLKLDLPGGGQENNETPFQTFSREVREEFGLTIGHEDIVYARKYESSLEPGKFGYFVAAKLPANAELQIVFGNEGTEFLLLNVNDYVSRKDAWPVFQKRTVDYLNSSNTD